MDLRPSSSREAAASIATLPAPKNGQVRAVPTSARSATTGRSACSIGRSRCAAARRCTAARHLAQVVAIKRLQSAGRSLAEIQALWATLDDATLARMSGVDVGAACRRRRPSDRRASGQHAPRFLEDAAARSPCLRRSRRRIRASLARCRCRRRARRALASSSRRRHAVIASRRCSHLTRRRRRATRSRGTTCHRARTPRAHLEKP